MRKSHCTYYMNHERVVKVNLIFVFVMALSGLVFGFLTGSKSIITDGIVSTVIFVSSLVGIYVHSSLYPACIDDYPYGKWRFEYIYNLLRMVTLLVIIGYSFLESLYTIFHYWISGVIPKEIILIEVFPYFLIKMSMVFLSLWWLKSNYKKKHVDFESYSMESSSIKVDGFLTLAILIGIVVFSHIPVISKVADAFTLLIVAIILGISVFKELKQLIVMMIGKRIFHEQEAFIIKLINEKYDDFKIHDVYLEKHGIISMIYIKCEFEHSMTSSEFMKLERELKAYFKIHEIEKPMLHFYFDETSKVHGEHAVKVENN